MITRRQFLVTSTAITASQLLSSCGNPAEILNITILQGSIPTQLVGAFRQNSSRNKQIKFKPEAQLKRIFNLLKTWQQGEPPKSRGLNKVTNLWRGSSLPADLVTLGNSWLENAIAQNLIQPLEISQLPSWTNLNPKFQELVTKDDKIYAAPYRWGNTVIAYRKDKQIPEIKDWSDLWREEFRERISLVDNYREIIGLTAKKLGYSYNSPDLAAIPNLESELQTLHQQVKFYSSNKYLQPLILGDTWAAVGWSSDILPLVRHYPEQIGVIVPASGTALWADLWVKPMIANGISDRVKAILESWIEFCWENSGAATIMLLTNGISPILNPENQAELTQEIKNNQDYIDLSLKSLPQSEFILPLDSAIEKDYKSLWKKIRTS